MDRRKDNPRVPLWIRSSSEERPSERSGNRRPSYWTPARHERQERYERQERRGRPARQQRSSRPKRQQKRSKQYQRMRPPRYEFVATEHITLHNPVHLADWERRAEIIDDHAQLVQRAEKKGEAPWPIQVWKMGEEYILARGFASLAAAIDANLEQIKVVVAARFPRWELAWIDPKSIQGPDPLLSKALRAQKKVRELGWVFPPLAVTTKPDDGYGLGRGNRAAARLWAAQTEGLASIPVVIRPQQIQTIISGTVHIKLNQVHVVLPRHLRRMRKSVPMRLVNEVTSGRVRPIRVRRTDDGDYELVDGLLRLRAAQEAGVDTIYAIVETRPQKS